MDAAIRFWTIAIAKKLDKSKKGNTTKDSKNITAESSAPSHSIDKNSEENRNPMGRNRKTTSDRSTSIPKQQNRQDRYHNRSLESTHDDKYYHKRDYSNNHHRDGYNRNEHWSKDQGDYQYHRYDTYHDDRSSKYKWSKNDYYKSSRRLSYY